MEPLDPLTGLQQVLDAEEALYVEMHRILQQERAALAELDSAGVEAAVRSKESLADEAAFLEERRLAAARALAEELGVATEPVTLAQLCDTLGARGSGLREAHSRLLAVVGAVQELLHINAAFAGECLNQVGTSLQLLGRLLPDETLYAPSGVASPHRGGRLVRGCA